MRSVKLLTVSAAALSLSPAIASAAIVKVSYLAEYLAEAAQPQQPGESDDDIVYDELGSASEDAFPAGFESNSVSGGFADDSDVYTANGTASASADLAKGELKTFAKTNVAANSVPTEYEEVGVTSTVSAKSEISETFTITGTGTATFSAFVDVDWENDVRFDAFVRARDEAANEDFLPAADDKISIRDTLTEQPTGGITDQLITLSVDFVDAADAQLDVFWQIGGFAYAGDYCYTGETCPTVGNMFASAMLDAAGTANIFYSGSEGLNVSANTDGFLGDSAFQTYSPGEVNAVPLPASGLLMLFGLGGLGLVARRRRASA